MALAQIATEHRQETWLPPPPPTPASGDDLEPLEIDWLPSESDFDAEYGTGLSAAGSAPASTSGPELPDLPELPPGFLDVEPPFDGPTAQSKAKRKVRARRNLIPDLPPLPVGEMPRDGESRFDWRTRALSQMKRRNTNGTRWFPDKAFERVAAEKTKLTWGDVYHDELERYKQQCVELAFHHLNRMLTSASYLCLKRNFGRRNGSSMSG